MLSEVHSSAQTPVLSCVRRVLAEPLLITSRGSLAGRELSHFDTMHEFIIGALHGLR